MIEAVTPAPVTPAKPSRVWRMVLIVVTFQLVLIASGLVAFTALGLGADATGGCGGL